MESYRLLLTISMMQYISRLIDEKISYQILNIITHHKRYIK